MTSVLHFRSSWKQGWAREEGASEACMAINGPVWPRVRERVSVLLRGWASSGLMRIRLLPFTLGGMSKTWYGLNKDASENPLLLLSNPSHNHHHKNDAFEIISDLIKGYRKIIYSSYMPLPVFSKGNISHNHKEVIKSEKLH